MSILIKHRFLLGAVLIAVAAFLHGPKVALSALETCATGARSADPLSLYGNEIVFSVMRNGEPIGVHRVNFDRNGDELIVASRFEAEVKFLFLTAFEYLYESKAVWRNGCMVELKATTDDNGDKSRVLARLADGQLKIEGPAGTIRGTPGLLPSNHWNSGILESNQVLNTITGTVASINIADLGEKPVVVNAQPASARHYVYSGDLQTEVWYDDSGRWVKMRFRAEDGSSIEYICQKCRFDGASGPA